MTERELSQAVHLKTELDALRRVAALEPNPEVLRAIERQARAVELARLEVMALHRDDTRPANPPSEIERFPLMAGQSSDILCLGKGRTQ